jgi:predicted TIM-barrel fold metal-dependent hydrolase
VFRKFPGIKVSLAEGGIGWIPYFLERIDYTYKHHIAWTEVDLGGKLPSEIFNEHIITCFIDDEFGAKNIIGEMNSDMVAWECDYPHSDCTWPKSPEEAIRYLNTIPDNEIIRKITHGNAIRLFHFDPFRHRTPEASTVAALREEARGHDISIVSKGKKQHYVKMDRMMAASK